MSCSLFVQNAWKKDLCSNCFKGREDHAPVVDLRARYLANLKELTKKPPPPSILKGVIRKNVSAFKVHFPTEESQVIGFGGDEFSEHDEEEVFHCEDSEVHEDPTDEEEDKHFQRLTEANTEFNKDSANLCIDGKDKQFEIKKATNASLKLGQIQSSVDGRKQTLLVSVQPFGSPAAHTTLAVSRKTHLNNLLHDTPDSLKLSDTVNSTPILLSMTIPENSKTDSYEKDNHVLRDTLNLPEINHINNVPLESQLENNEETISTSKINVDISDEVNNKTEKTENRLSSFMEGKKNQITRGTILTKSHEQMKSKRYFQIGSVKSEDVVLDNVNKNLDTNGIKINDSTFFVDKNTISVNTNVQEKNVKNITNGIFSSKLLKKEFGIQSDLQLTRIKSLDYIDSNISAINSGKEGEISDSKLDEVSLNFVKMSLQPENKPVRSEMLIIDGVPAESREMVGEPDGRADSDDLAEPPPDLPTTPPPLIIEHIPRPSFLHNISKEKPKLPVKPKMREKSPPKDLVLQQSCVEAVSDPNLSPTTRQSKRQAPKPPPTPLGESPPKLNRSSSSDSPTEESPRGRRERASSCSPLPSDSSSSSPHTPEPRRSLSLTHDSLALGSTTPTSIPAVLDKKKGASNKMRSTIRKFLRLASREELRYEELGIVPPPPLRPRPEIIHPLDLNKSAVQVLRGDGTLVPSTCRVQNSTRETPSSPASYASSSYNGRPNKPPPPPRSQSLDSSELRVGPSRPPPPSRDLLLAAQSSPTPAPSSNHSVYVNLGEVRSIIAPVKPQRTASLREKEKDSVYHCSALQMPESPYESLAPECDLSRDRSSLPYYGSETESDIYCPYTFATSQKREEIRACKTRTVVHKTLEDNYGAVIVANHEALTQLLEQMSHAPVIPTSLRPLKSVASLQWTDLTVDSGGGEVVGGRVFLPAAWEGTPVTLCLTPGQARLPVCLVPVTQFFDLVASQYLHQDKTELVQVSVGVLVRQQFMSLSRFADQLTGCPDSQQVSESALLMVQLVNNLKILQAQGHEETELSQFVLSREEHQVTPRVCLLPHDNKKGRESLCQCALKAVELLPFPAQMSGVLRAVLAEERATSLTQAKAALELWLWGPTNVPISADTQESLQRWLDLERATLLQSLVVRRPLTLSCADYCHLSFIVRTNAKTMSDALALVDRLGT